MSRWDGPPTIALLSPGEEPLTLTFERIGGKVFVMLGFDGETICIEDAEAAPTVLRLTEILDKALDRTAAARQKTS